MRRLLIILPMILLAAVTSGAETVEIPFPSLVGLYPGDHGEVSVEVPFPMDTAQIISVHLRVSGEATTGSLVCDGMDIDRWPIEVGATMVDPASGGWWGAWSTGVDDEPTFDDTVPFVGSLANPPSWDFLAGGRGVMYFGAYPAAVVGICTPVALPTADVAEVTLIFEMGSTAPLQTTTWSTVKAIYR